jgi:hypothetical protein
MSHLRSTIAAALLGLSAAAAPALATNSDSALDRTPVVGTSASPARAASDVLTTGSISVRSRASSAKEGNAEQTNFAVPQHGQTSGGHAY